ncbi:MAG: YdcF family protein [Candidatus Solibacter usitatus]|nr:YdcF family protein [Candidatus Solibacter usitatus]
MRRRRIVVIAAVGFAVVLFLTHTLWLPFFGLFLWKEDPIAKADAILVLAGDWDGNRVLRAAEIAKQGFAPVVFLSGATSLYGANEAELMKSLAISHGYQASQFEPLKFRADSTVEESQQLAPILLSKNVHSLLIVTSQFHTRRSGNVFRENVPGITIHMCGSPTRECDLARWWTTRQCRKWVLVEWAKTIAYWIGL